MKTKDLFCYRVVTGIITCIGVTPTLDYEFDSITAGEGTFGCGDGDGRRHADASGALC